MKRLLVAVDGSQGSMQALGWARLLASKSDTELTLVCVAAPQQIEMTPGTTERAHAELEARANEEWCPLVRDSGVPCTLQVLDGDPAASLLDATERADADLLVLGARGAEGFDGLRIGSVADHVAHHTTRPLAVIPESATEPRLESILVGVDETESAADAVQYVAELAASTGAGVIAAYVYSRPAEFWTHKDSRSQFAQSETLLDSAWTEPLQKANALRDTLMLESSHTAEALISGADEAGADLIAVGTRSLRPLVHIRLGGVTMQLLHHSDLPVLIVPPRHT